MDEEDGKVGRFAGDGDEDDDLGAQVGQFGEGDEEEEEDDDAEVLKAQLSRPLFAGAPLSDAHASRCTVQVSSLIVQLFFSHTHRRSDPERAVSCVANATIPARLDVEDQQSALGTGFALYFSACAAHMRVSRTAPGSLIVD
jgi:hypothetical protein